MVSLCVFQLNTQLTAAATEKSRYNREIQDLKDDLLRANASSNRDNALKDKVFNDAKAEVMNLNKKVSRISMLKICVSIEISVSLYSYYNGLLALNL